MIRKVRIPLSLFLLVLPILAQAPAALFARASVQGVRGGGRAASWP